MLSLMAVVLFSLSFASCSKDDVTSIFGNKDDMVGTWAYTTVENEGTANEATVTMTYVFEENGTGSRQIVKTYSNDLTLSQVTTQTFTYTVGEPSLTGKMGCTLDIPAQNGEQASTVELVIRIADNHLWIGDDMFSKAEISKDIVGTWTRAFKALEGTKDECVVKDTYTFKKDGKGSRERVTTYIVDGEVRNEAADFTYTITAADEQGVRVLVTVDDADGNQMTFNVTINGDVMTMDNDVLYRVK